MSTCLYLTTSGRCFMQLISPDQNHYITEIPKQMAYEISKKEGLQIIAQNLPDGLTWETAIHEKNPITYSFHVRLNRYESTLAVIRRLGFRETVTINRPNNRVYMEIPCANIEEAYILQSAIAKAI